MMELRMEKDNVRRYLLLCNTSLARSQKIKPIFLVKQGLDAEAGNPFHVQKRRKTRFLCQACFGYGIYAPSRHARRQPCPCPIPFYRVPPREAFCQVRTPGQPKERIPSA